MQDSISPEIAEDLARLEAGIRQLKVQYDMFFAGSIPREPLELRGEIERLIRRYSRNPIGKYAARFQFNTLVGRFNSFSELWAKTLRQYEEGPRAMPGHGSRPGAETVVATCFVADAGREQENLRLLHAKFLEARRRNGEDGSTIPFDSFVRGIASQTGRLREKAGCDKVELRLVVRDRKVQLKARPGR